MIDLEICETCEWSGKVSGAYLSYCDHLCKTGKRKLKEKENGECPSYKKRQGKRKRKKNMDYIFGRSENERFNQQTSGD